MTDLEINSLRDHAKQRILKEMVNTAKKNARGSDQVKDYLILVMDSSALKVFSSCCKLFDVYKAGLYHIERLEKARKKYPSTNAIYLISPTRTSLERLFKDFAPASDDDSAQAKLAAKKPQYGMIHLFFTSRVSDELMNELTSNKFIVPRVLTFQEINLDFYFFNDNVFHLGRPRIMPMFKMIYDEQDHEYPESNSMPVVKKFLTEMANRLFTVCAIFLEYPFV